VLDRLLYFAAATAKFPFKHGRLWKLKRTLQEWAYFNNDQLPEKYLVDLYPGLLRESVSVTPDIHRGQELPYGERYIISALIKLLQPEVLFEFGTFTGATTTLLADCSPKHSTVHTIDLPDEEITWEPEKNETVACEFSGLEKYKDKIISHRCNSKAFDYSPYHGKVDFIYVDACHDYEDVAWDTQKALEMLSDSGVIVWDDYSSLHRGVIRLLNELRHDLPVVHIAHTRLGFYTKVSTG
jgi:hypothetical protein